MWVLLCRRGGGLPEGGVGLSMLRLTGTSWSISEGLQAGEGRNDTVHKDPKTFVFYNSFPSRVDNGEAWGIQSSTEAKW